MRRINTPDGLYHNADPTAGIAGTIVTAEALNSVQEEIISVITAAGIELDPDVTTQLRDAIVALTGGGVAWGAISGKPATATRWPEVAEVTGLQAALDEKATPAMITTAINALVNSAPGALDTLKELASALGNDANFASTMITALAAKAPLSNPQFLTSVAVAGGVNASGLVLIENPAYGGISYANTNGLTVYGNGGGIRFYPNGRTSTAGAMFLGANGSLSVGGGITTTTVQASGTIMAAGGFQIG